MKFGEYFNCIFSDKYFDFVASTIKAIFLQRTPGRNTI